HRLCAYYYYDSLSSQLSTLPLHAALPILVLQSDRRDRHRLALHLNAFLGLDCLVQAVGVAPAGHEPAGEVVHDDDLPVLYHVLRSEEHTSELQSRENLVCRLLLEKKKILY